MSTFVLLAFFVAEAFLVILKRSQWPLRQPARQKERLLINQSINQLVILNQVMSLVKLTSSLIFPLKDIPTLIIGPYG